MSDRGPGPVPNRWMNCPRKSEFFISERFLAFKTPLSDRFDLQVPAECRFYPQMLFAYTKSKKLKMGLWIDLTNTKRFYDRHEIETKDCRYVKLQCRGHGETPSPQQTTSFIEIVKNFMHERPLDIIGVHCTHGFNRTGFLIASFLVEEMDCSVEAALALFAEARPPGIYKEDYIKELFRRYEKEEDAFLPPPLPDWCLEYDDRDSGTKRYRDPTPPPSTSNDYADSEQDTSHRNDEESSSTQDQPAKKKRKREYVRKDASFMEGVNGVSLFLEQPRLDELHTKVKEMCFWEKTGFPGCQPVSMDKDNLKFLHTKPYRVSWKADGTRYMMLIEKKGEVYFFDRDFACFQVDNVTFPQRRNLYEHLSDTLIDGEMVIDKVNGQRFPRYLVYDIIRFQNGDVSKHSFFPNRLDCIKKEIIGPRYEAINKGILDKTLEPFGVRIKDFWDITKSASLLSTKFKQQLCHEPDGLIFQPSIEPYVPGPCPEVLKWKPSSMNSVDFKLVIAEEKGTGILNRKIGLLHVGGLDVPFAQIKFTRILKDLNNKIIECKFDNNQWVYMRQRTDKSYPNSYKTALSVCGSIKNPVTAEILLDFIRRYRFPDDNEMMPPPPSRAALLC